MKKEQLTNPSDSDTFLDEKLNILASAASILGSRGGKSRSERKAEAARFNGKKGGRPKTAEKKN